MTDLTWSSGTEWNNAQESNNIQISDGSFTLETTTALVDNFEQSLYEDEGKTLSDYYFGRASGDLSQFSSVSTTNLEGDTALQYSDNSSPAWIFSTSGLPYYPSKGDTIRSDFYVTASINQPRPLAWGVQDSDNFYYINARSDSFDVRKLENGNNTTLGGTSNFSMPQDTLVTFEVDWGDTTTVTASDETGTSYGSVSITNTTFVDGGIGFGYYNSETTGVYFDNVRVV